MADTLFVWNCHRGSKHDGGGTVCIVATYALALEWLQRERVKALEEAAVMNEHYRTSEYASFREQTWPVDAIVEEGDECASFEGPLDVWCVRPSAVLTELPEPVTASEPK